jgi:hypothetical protein
MIEPLAQVLQVLHSSCKQICEDTHHSTLTGFDIDTKGHPGLQR